MTTIEYEYLGGGYFQPRIDLEEYLLKILQEGPLTRDKMSQVTGIPRTTLYDTLIKLISQNKVEKYPQSNGKRGRSEVFYKLLNDM